ncbi:hypothetical protein WL28_25375 [Burkholderia ubonensis]|nr:hypothetical protein WL28_25375 [Burkholderia ubonensis]
MAGFEANLREKFPDSRQGYAAWRQEAVSKLPAGVFVWRDEFETAHRADFDTGKLSSADEREWNRDLTYTPMLAADVRDTVMAGFFVDTLAAANPVQTGVPQNAAEIHENRYRAVSEYAQRASFDVAELDAWAVSNRVPGSFRTLLTPDSVGADLPSVRRFQPYSSLPALIASAFVPIDTEPHEAQAQLLAAGDTGEYPNAVNRLRDVIAEGYGRLLLSAVYDGELNLYDTLMYTKIDVTVARLRYEAAPDAYVQAVGKRAMATHVSKMVELINNGEESIDWNYWVGKMPRWTAYQAVRLMAALDPAKHPDLSFKRKETAGVAKEHAQRLETLATSHRMNEASPSEWLKWADGLNEPVHDGFRAAVSLVVDQHEPAIGAPATALSAARRPPSQHRHQEAEILRVIRELGHDPAMLPKQKPGTSGVKSAVRQKLSFSQKVFNKAWERLRDAGDVADA